MFKLNENEKVPLFFTATGISGLKILVCLKFKSTRPLKTWKFEKNVGPAYF